MEQKIIGWRIEFEDGSVELWNAWRHYILCHRTEQEDYAGYKDSIR